MTRKQAIIKLFEDSELHIAMGYESIEECLKDYTADCLYEILIEQDSLCTDDYIKEYMETE